MCVCVKTITEEIEKIVIQMQSKKENNGKEANGNDNNERVVLQLAIPSKPTVISVSVIVALRC